LIDVLPKFYTDSTQITDIAQYRLDITSHRRHTDTF